MALIVSEDELLVTLGIQESPTNAQRRLVTLLHEAAERQLVEFLGYEVAQVTLTNRLYPNMEGPNQWGSEFLDIVGTNAVLSRTGGYRTLQLDQVIRSISDVREDTAAYAGSASGAFAAGTALTEGTDYYVDWDIRDPDDSTNNISWSGILYRIGGNWPTTPRTVRVGSMTVGFTSAELEGDHRYFKKGVWDTVKAWFEAGSRGPVASLRLADASVTYISTVAAQLSSQGLPPSVISALYHKRHLRMAA